jgi:uncharacterized protein YggE
MTPQTTTATRTILRCATIAFGVAIFSTAAHAQTIQVNKENRTIAITATSSVTSMADIATIHIGYIVYGPDSDWAYATGSRISHAIIDALTDADVPAAAIESANQSISPVQDFQNEKLTATERAQRKFQLTQSWTVRTAADDASKILGVAVKAGANQSGQVDWGLKDENAPQAEAAGKALQRARTIAGEMAKGLNARLGPLIYASNETQAAPPRPLAMAFSGRVASDEAKPEAAPPLSINPRRIEKFATVYAVFAIE